MEKSKKLTLLVVALLLAISVPLAMPAVRASPPITWSTARSYMYKGNLIYVVAKGGNLYGEVDIYKYYYSSGRWVGGLVGFFTVQGSMSWWNGPKLTATAYMCSNGFCYPVKSWESQSINLLEMYVRQYLQSFFAAACYYTNCFSLVNYVGSLIAPYTGSLILGSLAGVSFTTILYLALPLM